VGLGLWDSESQSSWLFIRLVPKRLSGWLPRFQMDLGLFLGTGNPKALDGSPSFSIWNLDFWGLIRLWAVNISAEAE
jgi:hypothetical protein